MASGSVWRVWIVRLSLSVTLSLGCERLQLLQILNTETLGKLNEMGGRLPRQCVTERLSLKTKPLDLVKLSAGVHAQDRIQIVHQTLHHIRRIYSRNLSSVTWAQGTVEHFRLLLGRQLRELEDCVRKPSTESRPRKNATILKYFRKLTEFLRQKGFSDCAWEITHAETRAHLQQLPLIMAKGFSNCACEITHAETRARLQRLLLNMAKNQQGFLKIFQRQLHKRLRLLTIYLK
ncbi:interferon alpha-21-like [Pristis pectinata]|uniref:interferon alpha-21-like n=1 Tax=Pristis pectinata TaxID=685728 RepID=UPI00223E562A|nr:interferon alpha-21-like [Pristis pectinata]